MVESIPLFFDDWSKRCTVPGTFGGTVPSTVLYWCLLLLSVQKKYFKVQPIFWFWNACFESVFIDFVWLCTIFGYWGNDLVQWHKKRNKLKLFKLEAIGNVQWKWPDKSRFWSTSCWSTSSLLESFWNDMFYYRHGTVRYHK